MFDGLDFLGAVAPATARMQQAQSKAAAAGQRALASAQKIARLSPRLAAAVQAAGQKAVAASKAKPARVRQVAKPATEPALKAAQVRPANAPAVKQTATPAQPKSLSPSVTRSPVRFVSKPQLRSHLGWSGLSDAQLKRLGAASDALDAGADEETAAAAAQAAVPDAAAEQQAQQVADAYSQLADAAASTADLMSELQGLMGKLPSGIPLAQQGQTQITYLEAYFVKPIEKALEGSPSAASAGDIVKALQDVMAKRGSSAPDGVWGWVANANAYLRAHGVAGSVATIAVNPESPTVAPGTTLQLTATLADATGKATTPGSPVQWTTAAGSTIDKNGNFSSQTAGSYVVKASADGIVGSTTVTVAAGAPAAGTSAILVQPQNPQVAAGTLQQFTATANNQPIAGAVVWSVMPKTGAAIDTSGNFLAQMPGMYTITATTGGQTGTTIAQVTTTQAAPAPSGGGYGGGGGGAGGYGGGSDGGADYGYGDDDGYAEPEMGPQAGQADGGGDSDSQPDQDAGWDQEDDSSGLDMMGLDLLGDSWAAIHVPDDYRNAAKALKASADNLNLTAANEPGWPAIYAVANDLYSKYGSVGFFGGLTLTDAAWNAIADAQQRVNEFEAQMRASGKALVAPEHKPIDTSLLGPQAGGALEWAKNHWGWLAAAGVAIVALPVVVPPLVSLAAAHNLTTKKVG